ncbi:MAG TPA: YggT family protein [bacterium]|nr:YggT family protein [bacterium]
MFPLGSFLVSVAKVLSILLTIYQYIILGAVIISWVNADPHNPIVRFLRQSTEPVFRPLRRLLPRALFRTGIDFTPLVAWLLIVLLENFAVATLLHYGQRLMVQP